MSSLPLIAHTDLDAAIAYRAGVKISARQFLADIDRLVSLLPSGGHVFNLCTDRYRFAVALAASIVTGRISLLPSTHTREMVRQMRRLAPDLFAIVDQDETDIDLPALRYPVTPAQPGGHEHVPGIDTRRVIAHVFTSGSTGEPVPHVKRWGSLVENVRAEGARLGLTSAHALIGTVPAQHMYGLESTVLMPLQCGAALHASWPFYPADICAALEELPRPRLLVSTPYHLRALLADQPQPPAADLLLCATAPLSLALARDVEARFTAPLLEIYGCTETGQLASRRPTVSAEWQTLGAVRLRAEGVEVWAEGGHIEAPTRLSDVIELTGEEGVSSATFHLHGRHADLINIAGKRASLAYLNQQLGAIPGVEDGVFLPPADEAADSVARLAALVVAPAHTPASLMQALRERIDPIFLPRPLLFVDALPRNATGKLPARLALELLGRLRAKPVTGGAA
jgi:acyl-coenzyme A synthetase/AMP-(fatty) acid ligase